MCLEAQEVKHFLSEHLFLPLSDWFSVFHHLHLQISLMHQGSHMALYTPFVLLSWIIASGTAVEANRREQRQWNEPLIDLRIENICPGPEGGWETRRSCGKLRAYQAAELRYRHQVHLVYLKESSFKNINSYNLQACCSENVLSCHNHNIDNH